MRVVWALLLFTFSCSAMNPLEMHLVDQMKSWQKRLGLDEWNLSLQVVRQSAIDPNAWGSSHWDARAKTATIQVLHSIKTLAVEMSYAMGEGDWKHLGELMDRHWQLNQLLDPHTANAPINGILDRARPYIYGAKLAGAGGGGFLMLLARDAEAAAALRTVLAQDAPERGACVSYRIAEEGLRVQTSG